MGSAAVLHTVMAQIEGAEGMPRTACRRLALLVTGILAAQTTVLSQIASALSTLGLTRTAQAASVERGLRRTLSDRRIRVGSYQRTLATAVDWAAVRATGAGVTLAMDDSSQDDRIHRLRLSLTYWGGSVPLAWAVWEQNAPLPEGHYWQAVSAALATAAARIPADVSWTVTADRAFDVAPFIDRVRAAGGHWVVRAKAESDLRFRDHQGREGALRTLLRTRLGRPGCRWKARGQVFKAAGWRAASVVGGWPVGYRAPLVVLTDGAPRWAVLAVYGQRFWIEAGFRNDKTHGWQWEASGVQGVAHQQVLVLAMAWATLLTRCVGVAEATHHLVRLHLRPLPAGRTGWGGCVVQRARHSVFTLGLRRLGRWLVGLPVGFVWRLPDPAAPSWNHRWQQAQIARNLFNPQFVRP